MSILIIEKKVLEKNNEIANRIRENLFQKNILSLNFISSPGSGKTSLIEETIKVLNDKIKIAVIEGDIQTDLDAQRVAKYGVEAIQIVTNGSCHLDASLVFDAIGSLATENINLLVIENVGNLVCPSSYDLGENHKVVIISVTEGEDKPLKYPTIFQNATTMVITKIDLLPYLKNFSVEKLKQNALKINPQLKIFETSSSTFNGITNFCEYILSLKI